jgi:hypothetical protein
MEEIMKSIVQGTLLTAVIALAAGCNEAGTAPTNLTTSGQSGAVAAAAPAGALQSFGFNGTASGFPPGSVFLTGGGTYDAATASNTVPSEETRVKASGGFRCTGDVVQLPLLGCKEGEGVRWDTAQLLASTPFKCSADDTPQTAVTGPDRVVLLADFYLAGNGIDESFTSPMIVSATDLAPGIDGEQNLWIKGVGCGTAVVNFSK